jgi:beta-phosphoglucomutase-like phosphatase (HAD superfamily)
VSGDVTSDVIRVAVMAFDGIVADTLPLRALALAEAFESTINVEGAASPWVVPAAELLPLLPGRTFGESMAVAMEQLPALHAAPVRTDLTLHDIIALRAQRAWSMASAHGVPLRPDIVAHIRREAARGVRIVLRSDSQRREVEPLLRLAGLEDHILFLRASDDMPRASGVTSLQASYGAIDARLDRLRLVRAQRVVIEVDSRTAAVGEGFAGTSRTTF